MRIGEGEFTFIGLQGDECAFIPPKGISSIRPFPKVSCSSDVYGSGCVCLIYLVWIWGGPEAIEQFKVARRNSPPEHSGQPPNERFFTIHQGGYMGDDQHYPTVLETRDDDVHVIIKFNEGIAMFFEKLWEAPRSRKEKLFMQRIYKIIRDHALVPNPEERASVGRLYELLKLAILKSEAERPPTSHRSAAEPLHEKLRGLTSGLRGRKGFDKSPHHVEA